MCLLGDDSTLLTARASDKRAARHPNKTDVGSVDVLGWNQTNVWGSDGVTMEKRQVILSFIQTLPSDTKSLLVARIDRHMQSDIPSASFEDDVLLPTALLYNTAFFSKRSWLKQQNPSKKSKQDAKEARHLWRIPLAPFILSSRIKKRREWVWRVWLGINPVEKFFLFFFA